MDSREIWKRLLAPEIDLSAIGLEQAESAPYFCTPVGAEHIGRIGCDGVHFILLPGDERVFCVDPSMGGPGTYVLPVSSDFLEFLSFVLFCRDAGPLSQISWLTEERFRQLLREDAEARRDGSGSFLAEKEAALNAVSAAFGLGPADPYKKVKALQADFDPACLVFSDEYYDVLGLEAPRT